MSWRVCGMAVVIYDSWPTCCSRCFCHVLEGVWNGCCYLWYFTPVAAFAVYVMSCRVCGMAVVVWYFIPVAALAVYVMSWRVCGMAVVIYDTLPPLLLSLFMSCLGGCVEWLLLSMILYPRCCSRCLCHVLEGVWNGGCYLWYFTPVAALAVYVMSWRVCGMAVVIYDTLPPLLLSLFMSCLGGCVEWLLLSDTWPTCYSRCLCHVLEVVWNRCCRLIVESGAALAISVMSSWMCKVVIVNYNSWAPVAFAVPFVSWWVCEMDVVSYSSWALCCFCSSSCRLVWRVCEKAVVIYDSWPPCCCYYSCHVSLVCEVVVVNYDGWPHCYSFCSSCHMSFWACDVIFVTHTRGRARRMWELTKSDFSSTPLVFYTKIGVYSNVILMLHYYGADQRKVSRSPPLVLLSRSMLLPLASFSPFPACSKKWQH